MTSSYDGSRTLRHKWIWIALMGITAAIVVLVVSATSSKVDTPTLVRADPLETYDPIDAGEPPPDGFRQLLVRDQIAPIYEPVFTSADEVDWPQDMLVVAISGTSESKAYPITHLNQREMVIDHIDGEPILVSW